MPHRCSVTVGLWMAGLCLFAASCENDDATAPYPGTAKPPETAPSLVASEETPGHANVALRNVLWQTLPPEISEVWVGPDHRIWFKRTSGRPVDTPENVRRVIEREFRKDLPHIMGAAPVLFEPGGRVWFRLSAWNAPELLMGYDGQGWVERTAEEPRRFTGHCPGHDLGAGHSRYSSPAWVDGCAFFADHGGVHCFDGKEWTYLDFKLERLDVQYIDLVPLADGKTLVAYLPHGSAPAYVWRGGAWSRAALPPSIPNGVIDGAALADEGGLWLFANDKAADYWPVGAGLPPDFAAARGAKSARLGLFSLSEPRLMRRDAGGGAYMLVRDVTDATHRLLDANLVVWRSGGRVLAITDKEYVAAWWYGREMSDGWLTDSGRRLWMPGTSVGHPARLIDLQTGRTVLDAPDNRYTCLHAVLPDGTAFMSILDPLNSRLVGVCRPGAPDDRRRIAAETYQVQAADVSPDGTLWAEFPENGIVRFEGRQWRPVKGLKDEKYVRWMVAGQGNTLLVQTQDAAVFVKQGVAHRAQSLRAAIEDCQGDIAAAFSPSGAPGYGSGYATQIVADKAGNVWLLGDRRLGVCVQGRWQDPLVEAGVDPSKFKCLAAVGDGSRVFLTYKDYDEKGRNSFLGEVQDGRVVFSPAPYYTGGRAPLGVRDAAGALWVHGWMPKGSGEPQGEVQRRVTEMGAIEKFRDAGEALLYDRGGNVWLCGTRSAGGELDRVEIWRDGRAQHAMTLAVSWPRNLPIVSDRPGSVWAWTDTGLNHLTADDPAAPARFGGRRVYHPEGTRGRIHRLALGHPGYLVAFTGHDTTDSATGGTASYVSLIPVPEE